LWQKICQVKKIISWWQNYFSEQDNMSSVNIGNTKFSLDGSYDSSHQTKLFAFGIWFSWVSFLDCTAKLSVDFFFLVNTWHVTSKYILKWRKYLYRTYFPSACTSINTQYNTIVVRVTACWDKCWVDLPDNQKCLISQNGMCSPLFAHIKGQPSHLKGRYSNV